MILRCSLVASLALFLLALFQPVLSEDKRDTLDTFMHACSGGDEEAVETMLKEDKGFALAATNEGETGLHLVAISGKAGIARALLDAGANPNARTTFDGGLRMHPLSWNVYSGHHEIVQLLLDGGARVNDDFDLRAESDEKVTVLDIAEKLVTGETESSEPTPFEKTLDLLVKRGAKKVQRFAPAGGRRRIWR